MSRFEIRPAVPQDAAAAADVWLRSRHAALDVVPAPVHSDDAVREWMASHVVPELACWIAVASDGTVVGLLVLEHDWVEQLYVLPEWQRHGVGRALLDHAKRSRPHGLQLWTFASNGPARRFYEQHGFVAIEQRDGADNEERAPDVRYVWQPDERRHP